MKQSTTISILNRLSRILQVTAAYFGLPAEAARIPMRRMPQLPRTCAEHR